MANRFLSLFDRGISSEEDLVAGEPKTLESFSSQVEDQEHILDTIRKLEKVELKIDYDDFSQFVFFNSALDYFNISFEKVINEYPYDGSRPLLDSFVADLDPFARHLLQAVWPGYAGHLRFNTAVSASYVKVEDVGVEDGVSRSPLLSPSSGSLAVSGWLLPAATSVSASNSGAQFVAQKLSSSNVDGYTVYLSASSIFFRVASGSATDEVSARYTGGTQVYFSCMLDRSSSGSFLSIATGSLTEFPVQVQRVTASCTGPIHLGTSPFYIGSGTLSGKVTKALTGSIDDVRVWRVARQVADISGTYNVKHYAQKGLYGLWRFNEPDSGAGSLTLDYSGHRLNGVIQNYYADVRGTGSLLAQESQDPIVFFDNQFVQGLLSFGQQRATSYDASNDNLITRLFPEDYFKLEEFRDTDVLEKFLFIIARYFDGLKVYIDQFVNVFRQNYGDFEQTPDALLEDAAKFFGWEFTGNFLSADAFRYIFGRNVLLNTDANKELDVKLYQIKNEFWKRVLINLMYLYKTKGTRESVESFLRLYGVNRNFVRLKEFGYKPNVGLRSARISAEKSIPVLTFGSSTLGDYVWTPNVAERFYTVESRLRFPLTSSAGLTASLLTGAIWSLVPTGGDFPLSAAPTNRLFFTRTSLDSPSGTLVYSGSGEGTLFLSGVGIFDNRWYNVAVTRDNVSGTIAIDVRSLDHDSLRRDKSFRVSGSATSAIPASLTRDIYLGSTSKTGSQHWLQEFRVWNRVLNDSELTAHALNWQSFAIDRPTDLTDGAFGMGLWYPFAEGTGSFDGAQAGYAGFVLDQHAGLNLSGRYYTGSAAASFTGSSINPFKRFLNEYTYLAAPDFGWSEDKIRVFDGSQVKLADAFSDNNMLALEFNMVDALNEDIGRIFTSLDSFNTALGLGASRYREDYPDLRALRSTYFRRLQGDLNFRVFADLLEFFDRSFVDMVRKLVPARAIFLGEEFVVESHMLERPKVQWNYRRHELPTVYDGVLRVFRQT